MNKYKNKKIMYDGVKFDSEMEMQFYQHLLQLHKKEEIILQPKFEILPAFEKNRAINYIADFQLGCIVYDVKGMQTKDFIIKKKLFEYKYRNLSLQLITKCPLKYQDNYDKWVEIQQLAKERKKNKKAG